VANRIRLFYPAFLGADSPCRLQSAFDDRFVAVATVMQRRHLENCPRSGCVRRKDLHFISSCNNGCNNGREEMPGNGTFRRTSRTDPLLQLRLQAVGFLSASARRGGSIPDYGRDRPNALARNDGGGRAGDAPSSTWFSQVARVPLGSSPDLPAPPSSLPLGRTRWGRPAPGLSTTSRCSP